MDSIDDPQARARLNNAALRLAELDELDRRRERVRVELVRDLTSLQSLGVSRRAVASQLRVNESTLRYHIERASTTKEEVPA